MHKFIYFRQGHMSNSRPVYNADTPQTNLYI